MPDFSEHFLSVESGDVVVIADQSTVHSKSHPSWWLGRVIHVVGGARNPKVKSLFQVACVDTGIIKVINADTVKRILIKKRHE